MNGARLFSSRIRIALCASKPNTRPPKAPPISRKANLRQAAVKGRRPFEKGRTISGSTAGRMPRLFWDTAPTSSPDLVRHRLSNRLRRRKRRGKRVPPAWGNARKSGMNRGRVPMKTLRFCGFVRIRNTRTKRFKGTAPARTPKPAPL